MKWYIKFPCDAYALGPIDFPVDADENDVRDYAKRWGGYKQLPEDFECWRA